MTARRPPLHLLAAALLLCSQPAAAAPLAPGPLALPTWIASRLARQRAAIQARDLPRMTHSTAPVGLAVKSAATQLGFDVAAGEVTATTVLTLEAGGLGGIATVSMYLQPLTQETITVVDAQGPLAVAAPWPEVVDVKLRQPLAPGQQLTLTVERHGGAVCTGGFFGMQTCMISAEKIFDIDTGWQPLVLDAGSGQAVPVEQAELAVTVPAQLRVAATGYPAKVVDNQDGTHTVHYTSDREEVITFSAAQYVLATTAWGNKTVGSYLMPANAAHGEAWRQVVIDAMTFHGQRYGSYEPAKIDLAELPDAVGGAVGAMLTVFVPETWLASGPVHWSEEIVLAHELAHQWFGGVIATADFDSPWLHEGFATFAETEYTAVKASAELGGDYRLLARTTAALEYLYGVTPADEVPISSPQLYDLAVETFDTLTYQKGSLVVGMIRHLLGDQAFGQAMLAYRADHLTRGATVESLRTSIENATGRDLRPFFARWAFGVGYSTLGVEVAHPNPSDPQGLAITVTADQPVHAPLDLVIFTADGRTSSARLEPDASGAIFRYEASTPSPVVHVAADPDWQLIARRRGALPGDVRIDGEVDGVDLITVAARAGCSYRRSDPAAQAFPEWADLVVDGVIDRQDVNLVAGAFGRKTGDR